GSRGLVRLGLQEVQLVPGPAGPGDNPPAPPPGRPPRGGMLLEQITRRAGIQDRLFHRPDELSGGQQQRVALCRALINRPDLVCGDEPTGALDSESSRQVMTLLREAVDEFGQTLVLVTHDPLAASYADQVLFLVDGAIADTMASPTSRKVAEHMTVLVGQA